MLIVIFNLLSTGKTYAAKIGIVTDTHYDRVLYPNRADVAQKLISIFNSENVDLVLGIGDMYQGDFANLDDYLQDKALYEAPYAKSVSPVRWVVGNHDASGISTTDYTNNSTYATGNGTIDISENWRVVYYTNIEYPYFSAKPATLDWLKNALEQARADGKKVIIATHAHIDMDYPSIPRDVFGQMNFTSRVPGTVLSPSNTTGIATVSASLPGTFVSGDKYRLLQLQHGTTWGFGMITSYIDSQTVTVNVKSAFGAAAPADNAELGGYSSVSYNADEQRAIIDASVASGTQVKYVFSGHASKNTQSTVNGVTYFGFIDTQDNGASAIADLKNDAIDIASVALSSGPTFQSYNHTTYYVDGVNGNNNNPGMVKSNAWKTLYYAKKTATAPGSTIFILPATYRESVYLQLTGTQSNPITWTYQQGARQTCAVIIKGFSGPDANGWFTKALATQAKEVIEDAISLVEGTYSSTAVSGTWDWNAGILYYKPSTGTPTDRTVEAGQLNTALQIPAGGGYLKINGGEFYGCNSNGILIQNDANNIEINRVNVWGNINGLAIDSTGSNNLVTKSKFSKNNTGIAIYQGAPNIAYNILTNNQTGISIGGTSYPFIDNATLYGNKYGIQIGNKDTTVGPMIRNIITSASRGINSYGAGISTVSNSIISDKVSWGKTIKSNILTVNPMLVNPAGNDFNLSSASAAIDFGMNVGLTNDYAGNPIIGLPDAGALEYQK
ncbi:MAG: metallophosphoesterase [Actinobacteria bacterium]|nr:metallophosphoesterase [Actinomycetota bacterium]